MLIAVPGEVKDAVNNQPRPEIKTFAPWLPPRGLREGSHPQLTWGHPQRYTGCPDHGEHPSRQSGSWGQGVQRSLSGRASDLGARSPPQDDRGWMGSLSSLLYPPPIRPEPPSHSQPSSHLCSPCFCLAYSAAMATLLNTQNPLAAPLWLWCPGGLQVKIGWDTSGSSCALTGPPTDGSDPGRGRLSPHQGKPVAHSPRQHGIHQLQRSPHGQPGTVEGTLWGQGC